MQILLARNNVQARRFCHLQRMVNCASGPLEINRFVETTIPFQEVQNVCPSSRNLAVQHQERRGNCLGKLQVGGQLVNCPCLEVAASVLDYMLVV